jgi:hypothetical protein
MTGVSASLTKKKKTTALERDSSRPSDAHVIEGDIVGFGTRRERTNVMQITRSVYLF